LQDYNVVDLLTYNLPRLGADLKAGSDFTMVDANKTIGIGILTVCVNIVLMAVKIFAGHQIGHAVKDHLKAVKPHIVDVVVHLEPHEVRALK
jgi:hypothetical protein